MILLIDGYNLIKSTIAQHAYVTEETRNSLINRLNNYCKKKGHKAVVVFDGGDFSFPTKYNEGDRLTVVYSGYKESADKVIKVYLSNNRDKDLLLVSSDRELQKSAESLNFDFISVQKFYILLLQSEQEAKAAPNKSQGVIFKTTPSDTPELDELMSELPNVVIKKDNDIISSKDRNPKQQSKKDKKLEKKINKL